MTDDTPALTVEGFVEYCETQAGLLAGRVETLNEEIAALLDDVDGQIDDLQTRLDDQPESVTGTETPESTTGPDGTDVDALVDLEADIEERQAEVAVKQARLTAVQELAAGYTDLAERLQTEAEDGEDAFERVVEFEVENDAESYFPEVQTVTEAARQS